MTAVLYWDPLFTPTPQYLDNPKHQTNLHQDIPSSSASEIHHLKKKKKITMFS